MDELTSQHLFLKVLPIANFVANEDFMVKYILLQKITFEKIKPVEKLQCYSC